MTDQQIKTSYERDGYVVVKDIITKSDLDPMRSFIKVKVDAVHQMRSRLRKKFQD